MSDRGASKASVSLAGERSGRTTCAQHSQRLCPGVTRRCALPAGSSLRIAGGLDGGVVGAVYLRVYDRAQYRPTLLLVGMDRAALVLVVDLSGPNAAGHSDDEDDEFKGFVRCLLIPTPRAVAVHYC